jgi:hypothetical protein
MPDLFFDWLVTEIRLETTPWKEVNDSAGRVVRTRDETRTSYVEVPATNAWNDDSGHAHYILHCKRV